MGGAHSGARPHDRKRPLMRSTRARASPARANWSGPRPVTTARPGVRGMRVAVSSPRTSIESAAVRHRSATRMSMFARIDADTAPAGRCVAATRWRPRERPCAARRMMTPIVSGWESTRTRNSSMAITMRAGGGATRAGSARWRCAHWRRSGTPMRASWRSRSASSAPMPRRARAVAPGSMSVRTHSVWARPDRGAKVAPPL